MQSCLTFTSTTKIALVAKNARKAVREMFSSILSFVFLILGFTAKDPYYTIYFVASGLFAIASNVGNCGKGGE